jgi:DNA-binding NarL/FixJ family response regulator
MVEEISVLLIDGPAGRQAALPILRQLCCLVATAGSARQAMKRLRAGRFDLVITELDLPDLHGLCLLSILRRLYPDLPVLVLTRDPSLENMIKALTLGAEGYLHKTEARGEISLCIQEILRVRSTPLFPAIRSSPAPAPNPR